MDIKMLRRNFRSRNVKTAVRNRKLPRWGNGGGILLWGKSYRGDCTGGGQSEETNGKKNIRLLSKEDIEALENVTCYISDHYAFDIPLSRIAGIPCMSKSKLKNCFKRRFGCSITQYIQGRRMSQAEHLLINTDFTMGQIAQMIGYTTSSRFAELFKKNTEILPIGYRKIARKDK